MRDIAREAGYTQGAFYSNFQSKEDLLLDLLRQHKAQEAERITGSVATAGQDFGKAFEALEHWRAISAWMPPRHCSRPSCNCWPRAIRNSAGPTPR